MPSPKINHRKAGGGHELKNRKGRLSEKSSSFCVSAGGVAAEMIPRPRTVPDLLEGRRGGGNIPDEMGLPGIRPWKLTKLLLNVTVQRCLGPVQVVIPPEATVEDLIAAVLRQYAKEARRPILSPDPAAFDLHYSQFSLESLDRGGKLSELGSRNFFLCPKVPPAAVCGGTTETRCSRYAEEDGKKAAPWLKFKNPFAVKNP